jgi:hypothetical protein
VKIIVPKATSSSKKSNYSNFSIQKLIKMLCINPMFDEYHLLYRSNKEYLRNRFSKVDFTKMQPVK